MVGNFAISWTAAKLKEELRKDGIMIRHYGRGVRGFIPKFSNKPTDKVPFIRQGRGDLGLEFGKWSMSGPPSRHSQKVRRIINANPDTVARGGRFYNIMRSSQRAIIVCDGFYVSSGNGKNFKPYFVRRKDWKPLYMAGLYERTYIDGTWKFEFVVITTTAGEGLDTLYTKQPVLLLSSDVALEWVNTSSKQWTDGHRDIILNTCENQSEILEWYQVPRQRRGMLDSPSFIEPVPPPSPPVTVKHGIREAFENQVMRQSQPPVNQGSDLQQQRPFRLTEPRKLLGKRKRGRKPSTIDLATEAPKPERRKGQSDGTSSRSSASNSSSTHSQTSAQPSVASASGSSNNATKKSSRIQGLALARTAYSSQIPTSLVVARKATASKKGQGRKEVPKTHDTTPSSSMPSKPQGRGKAGRNKKGQVSAVEDPVPTKPSEETTTAAQEIGSSLIRELAANSNSREEPAAFASSSKVTLDDLPRHVQPAQRDIQAPSKVTLTKKSPAKRRKKADPAAGCAKVTSFFSKKT